MERIIIYDQDWNPDVNSDIDRLCSVFSASAEGETSNGPQERKLPEIYSLQLSDPIEASVELINRWDLAAVEDCSDQEGKYLC